MFPQYELNGTTNYAILGYYERLVSNQRIVNNLLVLNG